MATFEATKERKKLESIIKDIPADKKKFVAGLIADASFMAEQLEILREYISANGWSESYQNGANQFGKKTSVEADMYVKVQKNYLAIIRQLAEYIPASEPADKDDRKNKLLSIIND